jgi:beta-lactamase regulating signal transducer with metallopeptidase domain
MMNYLWNVTTPDGSFEFLSLLALAAVKAAFLLAFVALICLTFRRLSAATRHLLWTSALCAALLLPFLSFLNFWEVPVLPAQLSPNALISNESNGNDETLKMQQTPVLEETFVSNTAVGGKPGKSEFQTETQPLENFTAITETSEPEASPQKNVAEALPQLINWALAVWIAGALFLLLRLLLGITASSFLARRGAEFKDTALNQSFLILCAELKLKNKTRLLCCERTKMPVVCGVFRPAVLLPADAAKWSAERKRIVLLHELAHVARRDCLTQMLAQVGCAFYWFNPLVWFAARRLRVEREQACDDYVLSVGTKASDYAYHLLEIARLMQEERSVFHWSQTTNVAMARQSQLENRLLAILSEENRTGAVSRAATLGIAALICVLLVSLAVIRPTAINAQKSPGSEPVSSDPQDRTETPVLDPLPIVGSEQRNNAAVQSSKAEEALKKQADSVVLDDSSEKNIADKPVDKDVEQKTTPRVNENLAQNISETAEPRIAATLQTPEVVQPPAPEVSPFINAGYRQESNSQTQKESGDFIDEMASVGLTNLSVDELIMLKTHRVTAAFVRGLRAGGFSNLTPKAITNLRIYNVTPAYIEAMAAVGYKGLTLKELTNARIYKVTPEFAKEIQIAGYPSVSIGQLIQLRIYNITPELVRSARSRLGDLTPKQIVSLKISGVMNVSKDENKDKNKK